MLAEEKLREPESKPLFTHPSRALKEQARWQRCPTRAGSEPLAERFVSVKIDYCHNEYC